MTEYNLTFDKVIIIPDYKLDSIILAKQIIEFPFHTRIPAYNFVYNKISITVQNPYLDPNNTIQTKGYAVRDLQAILDFTRKQLQRQRDEVLWRRKNKSMFCSFIDLFKKEKPLTDKELFGLFDNSIEKYIQFVTFYGKDNAFDFFKYKIKHPITNLYAHQHKNKDYNPDVEKNKDILKDNKEIKSNKLI